MLFLKPSNSILSAHLGLLLIVLAGCASTSSEVRSEMQKQNLNGRWKVQGTNDKWMDISCEGNVDLDVAGHSLRKAVVKSLEKNSFETYPNPFNDRFKIRASKSEVAPTLEVSEVPESTILKVLDAFSSLSGQKKKIIFEKTKSYSCSK